MLVVKRASVNTQALIFVVDSNDLQRIDEARETLDSLLNADELRDCVILIYANTQDFPNALKPAELGERLRLHSIRSHDWHMQGTCATTGDGLYEGLDWLGREINKRF
jgi:signal recognition particle receptor subunit beta